MIKFVEPLPRAFPGRFGGIVLSAALLASTPALATNHTTNHDKVGVYSYAEITYQRLSYERTGSSNRVAHGGGVSGSWEFARNLYAFGGYNQLRDGGSNNSLDLRDGHVGTGFAYPITPRLDLFAEASLLYTDTERCIDGDCIEFDTTGYGLGLGAWIALSPGGGIRLSWTEREFDDSAGDAFRTSSRVIEFGLHSRYSGHGVVLGGQQRDNGSSFRIGYRYTF